VDLATSRGLDADALHAKTPLHFAAHFGHVEMVRRLLAAGANAAAVDSHGHTALHYAAHEGHLACIRALLSHMVNARDASGNSALHFAAAYGAYVLSPAPMQRSQSGALTRSSIQAAPIAWRRS